jgi:hypothetical protein
MIKLGVAAIAPEAPSIDLVYSIYVCVVIAAAFYLMHVKRLGPLPVMLACGALNLLVSGFIL